jgi:ADP-ribosylglycohydrolase
MRYSLINRFESAWLGGMLGEALAHNKQQADWLKISNYQPSLEIQEGRAIAQSLIEMGTCQQQQDREIEVERDNSSQAALTALPIILFYHESFSLFTTQLRQKARYWQNSALILEDVLIWGYILALALREKLNTQYLVDQVLVGVGKQSTPLIGQLKQIKIFLAQGKGLEQVVENLSTRANFSQLPLALAIYCFATTPEDFSLCIRRAASTGNLASITSALTGILAGVYNGISGIPLNWYIASRTNSVYQAAQQQAKYLYQAWSGIYQPDTDEISRFVVASPKVIQSRSSLSIISQKEE